MDTLWCPNSQNRWKLLVYSSANLVPVEHEVWISCEIRPPMNIHSLQIDLLCSLFLLLHTDNIFKGKGEILQSLYRIHAMSHIGCPLWNWYFCQILRILFELPLKSGTSPHYVSGYWLPATEAKSKHDNIISLFLFSSSIFFSHFHFFMITLTWFW